MGAPASLSASLARTSFPSIGMRDDLISLSLRQSRPLVKRN